jgi:hypothetical protein
MSVATLKAVPPAPDLPSVSLREAGRAELAPRYFDTELIVTPEGNPAYTPAMLADLVPSVQKHGQLVPGWVCPSPELTENQRLCLEGNRRLAVARLLGLKFWAFDLERFVPEAERIELMFHHHQSRRVMSRDEIAERAARYMELTGCTAAEAAKVLNVSGPALSRAFGERRIPPELKPRADLLGLSIRSLVAAAPAELMAQAVQFAGTPGTDGRNPTRDQVSAFIRQLKKSGKPKSRKTKTVTLRMNGRMVAVTVNDRDSAASVAEDLRAIVARLGKHADVAPDGWHFLFQ